MAGWKKVLTKEPLSSDLSAIDATPVNDAGKVLKVDSTGTGVEWATEDGGTTTLDGALDTDFASENAPVINEHLMYNGTKWVSAPSGTLFTFGWDEASFDLNDNTLDKDFKPSTDTTYTKYLVKRMGPSAGSHIDAITVAHTLSNASTEASFDSGLTAAGNDAQGVQLVTSNGLTTSTIDSGNLAWTAGTPTLVLTSPSLAYPTIATVNDAFNEKYNRIDTNFQYDGVQYSTKLKINYGNDWFFGLNGTATSLATGTITALDTAISGYQGLWDGGTTSSVNLSAKEFALNGVDNYIHFYMPKRITTTPTFKVGDNAASLSTELWTALDTTIEVTNDNSYMEEYKGWRSPTVLNNTLGVHAWYVAVDFN